MYENSYNYSNKSFTIILMSQGLSDNSIEPNHSSEGLSTDESQGGGSSQN